MPESTSETVATIEQQPTAAGFETPKNSEKMASRLLTDSFSRVHNYLRISLTEKCSLRCRYCMPPEGVALSKPDELMSVSEMVRLSSILTKQRGLAKIRLTGGEPLVRKELTELVTELNALKQDGLEAIGMTTNGVALTAKRAQRLKTAGLDTVNISLDTLEPMKAEFITRRPSTFHKRAISSLDHALDAGLNVKVNCVLQRDLNFDEIVPLVELARHRPISIRFIEFMPFNGNDWAKGAKFVSLREILQVVTKEYGEVDYVQGRRDDVAREWRVDGFNGTFGIIGSMSQPFCSGCSRLRITANGKLKTCLFSPEADDADLLGMMRADGGGNVTDDAILAFIESALATKKASHGGLAHLVATRGANRPMTSIGG